MDVKWDSRGVFVENINDNNKCVLWESDLYMLVILSSGESLWYIYSTLLAWACQFICMYACLMLACFICYIAFCNIIVFNPQTVEIFKHMFM